jgi:hypothetical protein
MLRALTLAFAALAILAAVPARAQDRPSGAEQEYSRLNADRAHRLGVQQYRLQHYDAALRQFEKAVALAPDVDTYRRSLLLTRQRIALNKANEDAVKGSVDRARDAFTLQQQEEDAARPDQDDELPGAKKPGAAGGDPLRPRASSDPARPRLGEEDGPLGSDAKDREILAPDDMVRDPMRDLNLGGFGTMPNDLPVAGSNFDLPIGRMPREPVTPRPLTITTPGDAADTPSILQGIDTLQSTPKPPESSPDGPRLDTPQGLP